MNPEVFIPQDRLVEFCRANGIMRLAIFGSALRDDIGPESDIDVLVEFAPERIGLVTPGTGRPSCQLMAHADFSRPVRPNALPRSQLPDWIPGTSIRKHARW